MKSSISVKRTFIAVIAVCAFAAGILFSGILSRTHTETMKLDTLYASQTFVSDDAGTTPFYCKPLKQRYYVSRLSAPLYQDFVELYNAVMSFDGTCSFPHPMSKDDIGMMMTILHLDCPEVLQINSGEQYQVNLSGGRVTSISLPYCMDKAEFDKRIAACQNAVNAIKKSIPAGLSQYDTEMKAYDAIDSKCLYNELAPFGGSAWAALVGGQAKCDGLSLAMKWIMDEFNIPCSVLSGSDVKTGMGHSWNNIVIDGVNYDLDLTSDTLHDGQYTPLYYATNVSSKWIRSNYAVSNLLKRFDLPCTDNMAGSFHGRRGTFVNAGSGAQGAKAVLFAGIDQAAAKKGNTFFMQFESDAECNDFVANVANYVAEWSAAHGRKVTHGAAYSTVYRAFRFTFTVK